ncbi:flagellin [Methylicorpusculum sp.]|uniref:flagellin N-terminal helical domain-containing protein n=1 Tax=Methylicorpusculum sp. TaxID=2713644 RepID=UPI00272F6019|nr:flagellin [Methylicorpusculum sp.]MDP2179326.1 flagellin [Methylicorpusculum sp.]MDP3530108.1 flagellin [Methylicorpusculum sp.]MDZ4152531.1 flagellin [Methylicorpusculum sp.]
MAQVINTNVSALTAQRNLNKSQSAMQTNLQRLSSGLRINSAKDDAAGLAISNRFQAQVNGLNQASRNANDGISLAQTAEGALDEVTNGLQRMRTLAVQAANDTNSASDRQSIQLEIDQIVSEINRIGGTTQFNGKNLLDGSNKEFSFQIGANSGQQLSVTMNDMRASALGQQPGAVQTTSTRVAISGDSASSGNIGVSLASNSATSAVAISSEELTISIANGAQAIDIAETRYGGNINQVASGDLVDSSHINYGAGVAKDIAARVNSIREIGEVNTSGQVVLEGVYATARTEFNIGDIASTSSGVAAEDIGTAVGVSGMPSLDNQNVGAGRIDHDGLEINGVKMGPINMIENDADGSLVNAINAKTSITGVTASVDNDGRLNLLAEDGRDIILKTSNATAANLIFNGGGSAVNGSNNAGYDFDEALSIRITGQVTYSATNSISFAGTASGEAGLDSSITTSSSRSIETNVKAKGTIANADVTTIQGANTLMKSVDSALNQVDSFRANLGSAQNRFEMTIRNLDNVSENLSAANSRIRDADFAAETTAMTRNQILQQAGISMLSQANAQTQNVMSLLR